MPNFDPNPYIMKLKGKEYLPVAARIAWMRSDHPEWGIVTEEVSVTDNSARFRATIFNDDGRVVATATKCEDLKGFPDFVEKAETGSIGRALALCGYGTLQCLELEEGTRLADSPVEAPVRPAQPRNQPSGVNHAAVADGAALLVATEARRAFYKACLDRGYEYRGADGKPDAAKVMEIVRLLGWSASESVPPQSAQDWDALKAALLSRSDAPAIDTSDLDDPFTGGE